MKALLFLHICYHKWYKTEGLIRVWEHDQESDSMWLHQRNYTAPHELPQGSICTLSCQVGILEWNPTIWTSLHLWCTIKIWGQSTGHLCASIFITILCIASKHFLHILNINWIFLFLRKIIGLCWRILAGVLDENDSKEKVKVIKAWGFLSVFLLHVRVQYSRSQSYYLPKLPYLVIFWTNTDIHTALRVLFIQMDPYGLLQIYLQS